MPTKRGLRKHRCAITTSTQTCTGAELLACNQNFYDGLWADARLVSPERFNTWPLVSTLVAKARRRLEIAPGLRPRLPIAGTHFVDISFPALARLSAAGGRAAIGSITALPHSDRSFDLVCALDIVEHVADDGVAWSEIARVAAPDATVLLSTPLHPSRWIPFDDFVGHRRRYEPRELRSRLADHGLTVRQSAVFGMQPSSSRLSSIGMWFLIHRRRKAMFFYNRLFMPLALRFEKPLALVDNLIDLDKADEVLLVCTRQG